MQNITLVGNVTADPRLFLSSEGKKPRVSFSLAIQEGSDENKRVHFVDVSAFGTLATNVAESVTKGMRVIVVGRLNTYKREVQIDGEPVGLTMVSFTAFQVGPDLNWAVARVAKVATERPAQAAEPAQPPARAAVAASAEAFDEDPF